MSVYLEYYKMGLKKFVEYKPKAYAKVLRIILFVFISYIVWGVIYSRVNITQFTFKEMILYMFVSNVVLSYFQSKNVTGMIKIHIWQGTIDNILTKPIDLIKICIARDIGLRMVMYCTAIATFLAVAWIFSVKGNFLLFCLYLLVTSVALMAIRVLIALMSFWLTEIWGVENLFNFVKAGFSGAIVPLFLFPQQVQTFINYTPFPYMHYNLILVYLGKISYTDALYSMFILILWTIVMYFAIYAIYKKGIKKLESLGG